MFNRMTILFIIWGIIISLRVVNSQEVVYPQVLEQEHQPYYELNHLPQELEELPPPPPATSSLLQTVAQVNNEPQGVTHCIQLTFAFATRNPDGVPKQVITVNDQFPGPTIRANIYDRLVITVRNQLWDSTRGRGYPTTVHFHGIEMKNQSWWDGPHLVTQCPIPYGSHMTYNFTLHQTGTYWYHSHTDWQYIDGHWGFLIVGNKTDGVDHDGMNRYDDDILMAISDWHHQDGQTLSELFDTPVVGEGQMLRMSPTPDSALLNGWGNNATDEVTIFTVERGLTYRIRLLNPSASQTFNFSIDGHLMRAIEMDGVTTFETPPVTSLVIWPAQRYSLLVTMNSTLAEQQDFYIRTQMVRGLEPPHLLAVRPLAAIRYETTTVPLVPLPGCPEAVSSPVDSLTQYSSAGDGGQGRTSCNQSPDVDRYLNEAILAQAAAAQSSPAAAAGGGAFDGGLCHTSTRPTNPGRSGVALLDDRQSRTSRACAPEIPLIFDRQIVLRQEDCRPVPFSCALGEEDTAPTDYDIQIILTAQARGILGINRWHFSNFTYDTNHPDVSQPAIFHMYESQEVPQAFVPQQVEFGRRVQVVINNLNGAPHPYHLHGHTFWVMATGEPGAGSFIESIDGSRINPQLAIKRDTTHAVGHSWTVIRFVTNNPGAWLLHCHIHWHFHHGLGAVFVEGDRHLQCRIPIPEEIVRVCEEPENNVRRPRAGVKTPGHPHYGTCNNTGTSILFSGLPASTSGTRTSPAQILLPVEGVTHVQPGQRVVHQPVLLQNYYHPPERLVGPVVQRKPTTYINFFK